MLRLPLFIQTILGLGLLLQQGNSHAQLYFKAKNLTVTNGLSDNRVTCFHKDKKGFMWIGTRNGLNRYDGHSFKIYKPSAGNSISNEVVNDIAEDSKGRIWVATMEGLNIYDPATGKWSVMFPSQDSIGNDIPNFIVWDLLIDPNDIVWVASDVFEFCSYDIRKNKFTYYDWPGFAHSHPFISQTRYHSIKKFIAKNEHEFWLATNRGLVLLDISKKNFSYIGGGHYGDIAGIHYDAIHKKVFVSAETGLFLFEETENKYAEIFAIAEPYPSTRFYQPGENEVWLPTYDGLIKITEDGEGIRREKNIPQLSGSLLPGSTNAVYIDGNGIRWIATSNGISIYDPSVNYSAFLPLLPVSDREGINRMGSPYYDESSQSYFVCALDPGAVFIIHAITGQVKKIAADANGSALPACIAIKKDNENNLWLLTNKNVYRYSRATGKFDLFPTPNKGTEIIFRDMLQDNAGNYWFASFMQGIFYYDNKQKKYTELKDSTLLDLHPATNFQKENNSENILIGSYGFNIYRYNPVTNLLEGYYETETTPQYSSMSLVNDIAKDAHGGIWVATHFGGVFRYNPGMPYESTFTPFNMKSGLSNNSILSICSDDDTTLWLLTGNSLSALNTKGKFLFDIKPTQTFEFSAYGSNGKYPHKLFFNPVKKELLVGVGGGLLIHSLKQKDNALQFPIVLTSVRTKDDTLTDQEITSSEGYRLPHRSNSISFEFAGLYYGASSGLIYEYKLDGYEKEWTASNLNYTVAYQNLPPGSYHFYVRAKDNSGNVVSELSGFSFRIVPPFWRTSWFITLIFLVLLFMLWRVIHSLRSNLKLERMVNSFATSLYGQNTTEDIFWDTAKNCIEKLGFIDCVIYQRDETRKLMLQKAAYGPKNPTRREIANIIEIPESKGIVGAVAQSGKAVIISDTSKDARYIVDDEKRLSEIAVPILVDGKVFAVIDSEHPQKGFYKKFHLRLLKKIAAICSERITRHLAEERLRTKIARDLHDEMGSTLTSINIISKVAMEEKQEPEKIKDYFQKIKDHSGRMMESMSDMVWAINPVNDNFEKVILRMKEFAAEMLEPVRINYYFSESGDPERTQLNLQQRKEIYMIFKEAINNIVKYSEATEVNIGFQQNESRLKMTITDNGKGFDTSLPNSGNGLKNMNSRSAEMGASITIDSIKGTGTSISLELPVT